MAWTKKRSFRKKRYTFKKRWGGYKKRGSTYKKKTYGTARRKRVMNFIKKYF